MHQATAYETAGHALLLRHRRSHDIAQSPYWLHSIKVQSPLLKNALNAVFQGYSNFSTNAEEMVFEAPFKSLFFRRSTLKQAVEDLRRDDGEEGLSAGDEKLMQHLSLLDGVVADELAPTLKQHREMTARGVISYELAWTLFPPGSLVHACPGPLGDEQIFRVKSEAMFQEKKKRMMVPCEYVDFDGEKYGWATTNLEIPAFDGIKNIAELSVKPFGFHSRREEVETRLTERGRRWEGLAGVQCCAYDGKAVCPDEHRHVLGLTPIANVTGRIMVDTKGYQSAVWWEQFPELEPLDSCAMVPGVEKHSLTDIECLLCTPVIRGFSLALKQWATLSVESTRDVNWSPESWDRLVLPNELKDTVLTLVDGQLRGDISFDDFITGKGQGLVVLLAGPTGVGKTLTAESLSEHFKIPLFSLNPSDLGEEPRRAEKRLSELFRLALRWKSILLVDEAQNFLSQDSKELKGGIIASVLLRSLEYHRGVIFLTTNRPELLDLAVLDRAHATFDYPELSIEAKTSIWNSFVDALGVSVEIEPVDRDEILTMQMNGRQTRDLIKVAILLASKRGENPAKDDFVRAAKMVGAKAITASVTKIEERMEPENSQDAKNKDREGVVEESVVVHEPETASRLESIPESEADTVENEGGALLSEEKEDVHVGAEKVVATQTLDAILEPPASFALENDSKDTGMAPQPQPEDVAAATSEESSKKEAVTVNPVAEVPTTSEREIFKPAIPERRSSIGSTSKPSSIRSAAARADSMRSKTPTTPTRPATSAGGFSWPSVTDAAIRVAQHRPPTPQQRPRSPITPNRPLTMPNMLMGSEITVESGISDSITRKTSGESSNTLDMKTATEKSMRRVSWKRPWAKVRAIR